jgi:hypothetical protein
MPAPFLADGSQDLGGMDLQYLQPFDTMTMIKFEPEELPSNYMNC